MSFYEFPHTRTYDSDLGWLIKRVNSYDETIAALEDWQRENEPKIEDLEDFKKALEDGNLPQGVIDGLYTWATIHFPDLIEATIKTVFFTIDNGYFAAHIPDSWDEITFGTTGLDIYPAGVDYGHLTLTY